MKKGRRGLRPRRRPIAAKARLPFPGIPRSDVGSSRMCAFRRGRWRWSRASTRSAFARCGGDVLPGRRGLGAVRGRPPRRALLDPGPRPAGALAPRAGIPVCVSRGSARGCASAGVRGSLVVAVCRREPRARAGVVREIDAARRSGSSSGSGTARESAGLARRWASGATVGGHRSCRYRLCGNRDGNCRRHALASFRYGETKC